jgi:hypothetical protein
MLYPVFAHLRCAYPLGRCSRGCLSFDFSTFSKAAQNGDEVHAGISRSQAGADLCHRSPVLVQAIYDCFIVKHDRLKALA